jgi:hypothetical protein
MARRVKNVLTVTEVRDNIKQLREAALHRGAEVHFGERGRDEVVIIAASALAELKRGLTRAMKASGGAGRNRAPEEPPFMAAIRAVGTFAGPPDLSENHGAYLHGGKAFSEG